MKRELTVERLYFLGQFRNVKFINTLTDIPEHLAKSDKVTSLLFFQQILSCEIAYKKYSDMMEKVSKGEISGTVEGLEDVRKQTLEELLSEIEKLDNQQILNDYGKRST